MTVSVLLFGLLASACSGSSGSSATARPSLAATAASATAVPATGSPASGGPGPAPTGTGPGSAPAPDPSSSSTVILQVTSGGGLSVRRPALPPVLTLYQDGRLLVLDPDQPSSALPVLTVRQVSAPGLRAVLAAAATAGLGTAHNDPPVPDATTTEIVFADGGRTTRSSLTAGGTGAESAARDLIIGFVNALRSDPGAIIDAANLTAPQAFSSDRLALLVIPESRSTPAVRARSWAGVGADRRPRTLTANCSVIAGRPATAVARALREAGVDTAWLSAGHRWRIIASPLVPGQSGTC